MFEGRGREPAADPVAVSLNRHHIRRSDLTTLLPSAMIHDHKDSGLEKGTRAMAFPEVRRVVYEINPLEEVICQLRFPGGVPRVLKRLVLQGFREDGTFGPARRKSFVGCDLTAPKFRRSVTFQ
jgi:hypothetical protein